MKGQFMVVSAVIIGLTLITVGAVISDIQERSFEPEDSSQKLNYINNEAERLTSGGSPTQLEQENYRIMASNLGYRSDVEYIEEGNCFNVFLTSPGERYELECLPNDVDTGNVVSASADSNVSNADIEETIAFDGGGSFADSTIQEYEWDFKDSNTKMGEEVDHKFDSDDAYNVELTVTDEEGRSDRDDITIQISDGGADFSSAPDCSEQGSSSKIESVYDLQCMSEDLGENYELEQDIDASYTEDWENGFEPVGSEADEFTGSLDGKDYEIQDLDISQSGEEVVGLISATSADASITSLKLRNAEISGGERTGGLVGSNLGSISSIGVENLDLAATNNIGGIAGANQGDVETVYVTGAVQGENEVGGLIGNNAGQAGSSYAAAQIQGDSALGGLIGNNLGELNSAYWDEEASGQAAPVGPGGNPGTDVEGLQTSEMTGDSAEDNMAESNGGYLDFNNVWTTTEDYPEQQ